MLKKMLHSLAQWLVDTAKVLRREFTIVTGDVGVMLFFLALPLAYPIVYTLIYNPEVTREMPVAVVDNCRSAQSREFVRHADATSAMNIIGYAANLEEAKQWMAEKRCFAVMEIPADYSKRVVRGEQGVIEFYSDTGLLFRYRTFLSGLTELQMATDTELRQQVLNLMGAPDAGSGGVQTEAYFLGDPEQGFASFVMPGVVVMILQQSMILGICMLTGTARERRRRNNGYDPMAIDAPASATIIGKMLCYVLIYLPMAIYILHYIPTMFNLPHYGTLIDYMLFIVPMLIASAMLGLTLAPLCYERETSFVIVVFSSIVFLFLSGLTWPRYAMANGWKALGSLVPGTWGVEGFIRINDNAGSLAQQWIPYVMLWGLTILYYITALIAVRGWLPRRPLRR